MKTPLALSIVVVAAAMLWMAPEASAQIVSDLDADGVTWSYAYEADAKPDSGKPSFRSVGPRNLRPPADRLTVNNGVYVQDATAHPGDNLPADSRNWVLFWGADPSQWASGAPTPTTLQVRVAIDADGDEVATTPALAIRMTMPADNGNLRSAYLLVSSQWIGLSTSPSSGGPGGRGVHHVIDTSEMRTYRVTLEPTESSLRAMLYINGQPEPVLTTTATGGGPGQFHFVWGNLSDDGSGGTFRLDHLRWTHGQAVVPDEEANE